MWVSVGAKRSPEGTWETYHGLFRRNWNQSFGKIGGDVTREIIWGWLLSPYFLSYGELRNVRDILSQYLYSMGFTNQIRL